MDRPTLLESAQRFKPNDAAYSAYQLGAHETGFMTGDVLAVDGGQILGNSEKVSRGPRT